jgi:hypothetical protein
MSDEKKQELIIPVTREEFEQFMAADTFMPDCAHVDATGKPTCGGQCPQGYVCATFSYADPEQDVDMVWYACAKPEVVAQLAERAQAVDSSKAERKPKFVAFRDVAQE